MIRRLAALLLAVTFVALVSPSLAAVPEAPGRVLYDLEQGRFVLPPELLRQEAGAERGTFELPAALTEIGASAFEGTAVETAVLPGSVEVIGDYAFADTPNLRSVYIPPSTAEIGDHAFDGTEDLTLAGLPGTPAEDWARRHGYGFTRVSTMLARTDTPEREERTGIAARYRSPQIDGPDTQSLPDTPTGRPEGEVKADHCTGRLSLNVRDRYFP